MIETRPPAETAPQEPPPLTPAPSQNVSFSKRIRRLIFGNPISSAHAEHTLLPKILALPVFASDAISSVAYATQEIVLALGGAGLFLAAHQGEYTRYTMLI